MYSTTFLPGDIVTTPTGKIGVVVDLLPIEDSSTTPRARVRVPLAGFGRLRALTVAYAVADLRSEARDV